MTLTFEEVLTCYKDKNICYKFPGSHTLYKVDDLKQQMQWEACLVSRGTVKQERDMIIFEAFLWQ